MSYDVKVAGEKIPAIGHAWQVTTGLAAPIQGWILPKGIAEKIVSLYAGQEIELQLDTITVKRVIVLGLTAARLDPLPAPELRTLLFTDVRWYWTRRWLVRWANVRRNGSDTHFLGAEVPIDAQTPVPNVRFLPWSIASSNTPWNYEPFMSSLLQYASKAVPAGRTITTVIDKAIFTQGPTRIVEEVRLDDSLPSGLARAIAAFPGRSTFPDINGVVHVSDAAFGAEKTLISAINPDDPLSQSGHMAWTEMGGMRASTFHVLFDPEYELKLWADVLNGVIMGNPKADDPFLIPILRVPDKKLTVTSTLPDGTTATRQVAQNSYVPQVDAYKAWGTPTDNGRPVPPLSDDIVRKNFLGPWLDLNYVLRAVPDPDTHWTDRVRETKRCHRRLVQVNPVLWDKILSAVPRRAAVVDQARGTRADSPVFCGFALRPKIRWLAARITRTGLNAQGLGTHTGGTQDSSGAKDEPIGLNTGNQPAPCKVHIVDMDQGILLFEWLLPSDGLYSAIAPSEIEYPPDLDPRTYGGALNLFLNWAEQKLVARWKLATIISVIPASPNSDKRLFKVDVTEADARAYLGAPADTSTTRGPDKFLRVGAGLLTPRFAWTDDPATSTAILKAIGCGDPSGTTTTSATDESVTVQTLRPVNYDTEVRPLATAMAAAELAAQRDHYEGTLEIPMREVNPIGSLHSVTYRVSSEKSVTILQASGESPAVDIFALLPNEARAAILHQVQDD